MRVNAARVFPEANECSILVAKEAAYWVGFNRERLKGKELPGPVAK